MGNSSMLYVLGTTMLFLIFNTNLNRTFSSQNNNAFNYYGSVRTTNISSSVSSMLLSSLSDNNKQRVTSWTTISLFEGSAQYRIVDTVSAGDSLISVDIISYFGNQQKHVVMLCSRWQMPGAFSYSAVSQGSLSMSGGAVIKAVDTTKNAKLHADGNFSLSGANTAVKGVVTYSGSISGNTANILPVSLSPGQTAYSLAPSVPIPPFNPDDFKSKATQIYTGNYSPSGTVNLGTKTNPAIIYVGGDLTLSGGTLNGYIIFLVKGSISMTGGTTFLNPDPSHSNFGFYSVGNIKVSGGTTVYGQMLTLGSATFTGNSSLGGTIAAAGTISISGGTSLDVPVSQELVMAVFGSGGGTARLLLSSYYE